MRNNSNCLRFRLSASGTGVFFGPDLCATGGLQLYPFIIDMRRYLIFQLSIILYNTMFTTVCIPAQIPVTVFVFFTSSGKIVASSRNSRCLQGDMTDRTFFMLCTCGFTVGSGVDDPVTRRMGHHRNLFSLGTAAAGDRTGVGLGTRRRAGGGRIDHTVVPGMDSGVAVLVTAVYAQETVGSVLAVTVIPDRAGVAVVFLGDHGGGLSDLGSASSVTEILVADRAGPEFNVAGGKAGGRHGVMMHRRMAIGGDGISVLRHGAAGTGIKIVTT